MADIAITAAQIAAIDPLKSVIRSYVAASAVTKGQAVYIATTGKVAPAGAQVSGGKQFRGIALNAGAASDAVDVLQDGEIAGFTVSGMNGDAIAYLSNTVGALATAAGSTTVACGRVVTMTDGPSFTKVLRIFTRWSEDWT